ncbi:N-acetyltransferase [Cyanidiococcus yangmingshanensis]|uniref:Glucosamine 6-phosphate N-acetyltransferase n=1 Tax=Cyanidiococcus yangmingshanensis TaxID=2690220 RepID=A0A7J7IJH4_9RHOD|nr:N-acetyltransferase [Cyanidiococcus yangmingshanensis]
MIRISYVSYAKRIWREDFEELLAQLTKTGSASLETWQERYRFRQQNSATYLTLVAVDSTTDRVVGTATLLIEHKFTRGCGQAGHIEDVVVDAAHRQQHLGSQLVRALLDRAQSRYGCYKVTLHCTEENAPFYAKLGLERKGVQMAHYFG